MYDVLFRSTTAAEGTDTATPEAAKAVARGGAIDGDLWVEISSIINITE